MTKPYRKVMGLALASGKVGHVVLRDGKLLDWKVSKVAARSSHRMQQVLQSWLEIHNPDCVITEDINPYSRKSERTLSVMKAAEGVVVAFGCEHRPLPRERHFANKYLEIEALAECYPAIAPWAPAPRKCYEPEPLNTILFEALALVEQSKS
ncbi:MAG: hypothetical protein ABJN52_04155 [Litorimonas sp.]